MLGDLFDKFVKDKTRYGWVFAVLGAIFVLAAIPLAQELLKRSVFSADKISKRLALLRTVTWKS